MRRWVISFRQVGTKTIFVGSAALCRTTISITPELSRIIFPAGTRTSRPQGGLALWVEFGKNIDTAELYELAMKKSISIAPGRMFTLQDQFRNCMRLCIGLPWSAELGFKLKQLGDLARTLHERGAPQHASNPD